MEFIHNLKLVDWDYLLNDIKRLNIKYDSSNKRTVYNGKSERGVLLGIKKKSNQVVEPEFTGEAMSRVANDSIKLDKNGLDYGLEDESVSVLSDLTKNEVEAIKNENLELKMRLEMMQLEMNQLKQQIEEPNQVDDETSKTNEKLIIKQEQIIKKLFPCWYEKLSGIEKKCMDRRIQKSGGDYSSMSYGIVEEEVEISTTEALDDDFDIDDLKALADPPKIIAKSTAQDKKKKYINVKKN